MPPMPNDNQLLKVTLHLPVHVYTILDGWAAVEFNMTPEAVLETLADALCTDEELRQYAARMVGE